MKKTDRLLHTKHPHINFLLILCMLMICCTTACSMKTPESSRTPENSKTQSSSYSADSDKSALYGYTDRMIELNENPDVYTATLWRKDNEVDTDIPRTFRTVYGELLAENLKDEMDKNYMPSTEGLTDTCMSGSAEFDEIQLEGLIEEIKKHHNGKICVVDLRQESHLFVNGRSLSWYGLRDWGNIGKNLDAVNAEEKRLKELIEDSTIDAYFLDGDKQPCDQELIKVNNVRTEKNMVEEHGINYYRLPCTDHTFPTDEEIDEFINFVKNMKPDTWLHFHCEAGKGRTTVFMVIYDMMQNPELELKDIVYRQCMLGGNNVLKDASDDWKDTYYAEKAEGIRKVYQYIQENHNSGYTESFSSWNK